jgi:inorganic pyrophosphatase
VALESPQYARCDDVEDVGETVLKELERFFAFYNAQDGKTFKTKRQRGKAAARKAVDKAQRQARKRASS